MSPTIADRLIVALPSLIERQRAALEGTEGLSCVQVIVQVDRFGPGMDRIDLRLEAAPQRPFRANGAAKEA